VNATPPVRRPSLSPAAAAPALSEHDRQRARVLASLLLAPVRDKPTRRRWA
jgi:hypothetical protein